MKGSKVGSIVPSRGANHARQIGKPTVSLIECNNADAALILATADSMELKTKRFASVLSFLQQFDPSEPGCVVADFHLPDRGAWELVDAINLEPPGSSLIFFAREIDAATAIELMKAGVSDILALPLNERFLRASLSHAVGLDLRNKRAFAAQALARHHYSLLTPREREVFLLVVSGLSSRDIAQTLGRSQKTVEVHRTSIMKKMQARGVVDLVRTGLELHLLDTHHVEMDAHSVGRPHPRSTIGFNANGFQSSFI